MVARRSSYELPHDEVIDGRCIAIAQVETSKVSTASSFLGTLNDKYTSLLPKMTCKDTGSYESLPPCIAIAQVEISRVSTSFLGTLKDI